MISESVRAPESAADVEFLGCPGLEFLHALASAAEAKMQECPGLYVSIRVCRLGIKVFTERAGQCNPDILTYRAALQSPSLAASIIDRASDPLCKDLRWSS